MKNKLLIAALAFIVFSCADDSLAPIFTFEQSIKGAYVRLLQESDPVYDLNAFSSAVYTYDVDFVDIEDGATVVQYDIYASFDDNTSSNGDNSKGEALFRSFSTGDFTPQANGNPGMSISVSMSEVAGLLGLAEADISATDQFEFRGEIITTSGSKHNFDNSGAPINGAAFQGHFNYVVSVACPMTASQFVGTYVGKYETGGEGAFGSIFGEDGFTFTFGEKNSIERTASWTYLPGPYNFSPDDLNLTFLCDIITFSTMDGGAGCGDGSITIAQGEVLPFDFSDDSSFQLEFVEFQADGGCGVDPVKHLVTFTKQ